MDDKLKASKPAENPYQSPLAIQRQLADDGLPLLSLWRRFVSVALFTFGSFFTLGSLGCAIAVAHDHDKTVRLYLILEVITATVCFTIGVLIRRRPEQPQPPSTQV